MPYADPTVRKAYHKQYSQEWFKRQSPDYKASRTATQKAAQRRWLEKNPDHHKKYYAERKHEFRERNLKKLYGITAADYAAMLLSQGGRCAICETDKPGRKRSQFSVDHCHKTGAVRGLLCSSCNARLGTVENWYVQFGAKITEYLKR